MIAFDCPHCHKPLIAPNNKAGGPLPCPGCKQTVAVPELRPPPAWRGLVKPVMALLLLVCIGVGVGWKVYRDREPDRLRSRLAATLGAKSPEWQGFAWDRCDPQAGDYRLSVFYLLPHKRYAFVATYFVPANQTFVRVDPSADETTWLSSLTFTAGETELFRYMGGSDEERDELERLSEELAKALNRTVR